MSTYRLDRLFKPRSVAVVGVGAKPGSVGSIIFNNLRKAGFRGEIFAVDTHHHEIGDTSTFSNLELLPVIPDLAVLSVPAANIPEVVLDAAKKGIAAAIIITAGLGHGPGSLLEAATANARTRGMRLLGPNCLGVLHPSSRLNASFAAEMPPAGEIALISQSGAVAAGIVAWSTQRSIGFSAVASIGDMADIDFGDLLDYFALDPATRSILLYIESIKDVRKFMSAARAAARTKPVIAIKAGRHRQAAAAAATHTGALAGSDAVYGAALERAGILRVFDLDEFFDAAETLARIQPFRGERLAILTNGGGVGVMAVDRLIDLGGTLASLSEKTHKTLDAALPPMWSKSNPVDIVGDADPERYAVSLQALIADRENDAIVVFQVPTALSLPVQTAKRIAEVASKNGKSLGRKPVFCAWIGGPPEAADIFSSAGIPHFSTENDAIRGFMHLVQYRRAQETLMEAPPSLPEGFSSDRIKARGILRKAIDEGRRWLDPEEVVKLLDLYQVPILPALIAATAEEAEQASAQFLKDFGAVAVKIFSRQITHKSDVGGVELNLRSGEGVRHAVTALFDKVRKARPDAKIEGVAVQPMLVRPHGRELIAGIATDHTFGPVLVFGRGGTAVEVINDKANDKALALPPLDLNLAKRLIGKTRVARRLKAYRNVPAADEDAVALTLVKLAQMTVDLPEIEELDINPLIADEKGVMALDARVAVSASKREASLISNPSLAIKPYPQEWERTARFGERTETFIRPIRPEDESILLEFLSKISPEDLRLRFFAAVKEFSHPFVARLTQLDYNRAMAFIALDKKRREILGVVRLHIDANFGAGEYAVLVRSDLKGRGLGWVLMELIIEYARNEGLQRIEGEVLSENSSMLRMCKQLGFDISASPDVAINIVKLRLTGSLGGASTAS